MLARRGHSSAHFSSSCARVLNACVHMCVCAFLFFFRVCVCACVCSGLSAPQLMSTSCGYTPDELLAVGFMNEDVGIVIMTCPAGEFYDLEQAACWKCLSGTCADTEGERIGENALVSGCT